MLKTTVYLPEKLKDALRRSAAERGVPEAEVIREILEAGLASGRLRRAGQRPS